MRLLDTIKSWFSSGRSARLMGKREKATVKLDPSEPWNVRRWNAAQNNGCHPNRWQNAHGQSINNDLDADLRTLMARCSHEFSNNPIFEGVINQLKRDVVGPDGPTLQIMSDDDTFNEVVEAEWRKVFAVPNPKRPNMGGVEAMKQWIHLLCVAGSYLNVFIEPKREDTVSFGWRTIHPRRLITPLKFSGERVAFGIRVDADGNPTKYYLDKPRKFGPLDWANQGYEFDVLDVSQVQHRYLEVEPEQMTGYPMMSSTLDTAVAVRELTTAELKAAARNAVNSLGLEAASPEQVVDPEPIAGPSVPMCDDEINVAPLGWKWATLDNNRPSPELVPFRHELLAELGRPVGMPLLIILLSVTEASFSSAQFGGMLYNETIRDLQSFLDRLTLDELVEMVILELVLSGKVKRPENYEKLWTHHVPPQANFEKFAKAMRTLIEDGVISRSMATAWLGFDPMKVDEQRQRENQRAEDLDISQPPVNAGNPQEEEPEEVPEGRPVGAAAS